jgi:Tol biopolymer transport system component
MIKNMRIFRSKKIYSCRYLIILAAFLISVGADAQYFGRNKPGYKKFEFDVVQTPNFELYHYLENDSMINSVSLWSEKWYQMHQKIFRDTFTVKNPVILYSNHADFQQTNAISGLVGTGTGGVTESLKNRVIIPVAPTIAQTDHVLGHELVHAFQYHMFLKGSRNRDFSLNNVPLWMIEGMAEYLSKGSIDSHTSMIMRDAVMNNDFPTIKQLSTESKYFPYTYGQAFWAMVGKTWGDAVIAPLLRYTAALGFDRAADSLLKVNSVTLSGMWKSATELHYSKYLKTRKDSLSGRKLISDNNSGEMNISPSISPDGKYIAFFSERNLFTLDLFLADVEKGRIIKKLSSVVRNDEIDDYSFIESSGTWSPDGSRFAFVVFSKGKNKLAILDVERRKILKNIEIGGITSFANPAWSPDGEHIALSGMVNGISDLYLYSLKTGEVEKLTDDFTADMHPAWSSDGSMIVYTKERENFGDVKKNYSFNIATLNLSDKSVSIIDVFIDSENMNPVFSPDDQNIYFLSDADGFRNLFRYNIEEDRVFRLTEYMTGITGITAYSPALSIGRENGQIAYNYFFGDKYHIYLATDDMFNAEEIDKQYYNYEAAILPPVNISNQANRIDLTVYQTEEHTKIDVDSIVEKRYRPKFKLDYISNNASIGVSTGLYRNNLGGAVNMIFSDMVGNNQIFSALSLNGEIYDFGGQVAYMNQGGKIKWGAAVSHIPYLTGGIYMTDDSLNLNDQTVPVTNLIIDYFRIFEDNITLFAAYPLSQTRRFEATASTSWYSYRLDRFNNYYLLNGVPLGGDREKMPAPDGNSFQQVSAAYVVDNSYFGMAAPMQGHRQRFQVERYFGGANFYTTLVDYRKYFFIKPVSLAFRLYNFNILGTATQLGSMPQLYLGNPWYIRGYENAYNSVPSGDQGFDISWLTGSRIAVANAELRIPFTGPERLALIKSRFLFTDLNLFFDAGMAWGGEQNTFNMAPDMALVEESTRKPVMSTGVSVRLNLFGAMIIEPYYAFPLQNGGFKNGAFGLNFIPGW